MHLYKYLPPERIDVLKNAVIRFTQPEQLNDPFESRPCMLEIRKHCRSTLVDEHPGAPPEEIDRLLDTFIERFPRILGGSTVVLSLSNNCDNQLMWSHYCDSHKGFVIRFDPESAFFSSKRAGPTEVKYSEERVVVSVDPNDPRNEFIASDRDFFLTKSADWHYEEEIRVLADAQKADKTNGDEDSTKIHLYHFPHSAVCDVILGCRMSPNVVSEIEQIVQSHYPSVKELRRARLNDRKFKMDIVPPINDR